MEVKINKEIRQYTESIFFGLSMRQFIFSIFACGIALILYFILKPYFGVETLSWICILGAFPFAIIGFVTYNGMTAEKFIIAWLKNQMIPKKLTLKKEKALEGVVIDNKDIPKEEAKSVELVDNYFDINKLFNEIFESKGE